MRHEEQVIREDDTDLYEEYLRRKEMRLFRRERNKLQIERLYRKLVNSGGYKPSIGLHYEWDAIKKEYIPTKRIRYGKSSRCQQWLKKISSHKARRLSLEQLTRKGNHYRKVFDYYWEWF